MDGSGFIVNIGIIGEMSTGKSTLLNAIFGDILAETNVDRTTMTVHRFYESNDINSNKYILNETKKTNEKQEEKFDNELKKFKEYNNKSKFSQWVHLLTNKVPKPKFFDLPTHKVKQSDLIPRIGM